MNIQMQIDLYSHVDACMFTCKYMYIYMDPGDGDFAWPPDLLSAHGSAHGPRMVPVSLVPGGPYLGPLKID